MFVATVLSAALGLTWTIALPGDGAAAVDPVTVEAAMPDSAAMDFMPLDSVPIIPSADALDSIAELFSDSPDVEIGEDSLSTEAEEIVSDLGSGEASYYGEELAGRPTASGEIFDPEGLTAAHPTLPIGSIVRVTNLVNGKSVVVRINDRGPFTRGRIIDVSRAAAGILGMIRAGTALVQLHLLPK
ncbi:MAG TPA: septal ring lytic transglycosylase RlpA family protein [Rhodothermales bacterium]